MARQQRQPMVSHGRTAKLAAVCSPYRRPYYVGHLDQNFKEEE